MSRYVICLAGLVMVYFDIYHNLDAWRDHFTAFSLYSLDPHTTYAMIFVSFENCRQQHNRVTRVTLERATRVKSILFGLCLWIAMRQDET